MQSFEVYTIQRVSETGSKKKCLNLDCVYKLVYNQFDFLIEVWLLNEIG